MSGQDVMNPYVNLPLIDLSAQPNEVAIFPPSWNSQPNPVYSWANRGLYPGYSGEYEILLGRHPWDAFSSQ